MADYSWLLQRVNHLLCGVHTVFIHILTVINYTKSTRTKFNSKYLLKTGFLGKDPFRLEFSSSFSPSFFFFQLLKNYPWHPEHFLGITEVEEFTYYCPIQANINLGVNLLRSKLLFRVGASPCTLGATDIWIEQQKSSNNSKALLVSYLQLFAIFSSVFLFCQQLCELGWAYGEHPNV